MAGVLLALTLAGNVRAADFAWYAVSRDIGSAVEQQSGFHDPTYCAAHQSECVWNPTVNDPQPRMWTTDDHVVWWANTGGNSANLSPGSYTVTEYEFADIQQRLNSVSVTADTPDLSVTVHFEPQGATFAYTPVLSGRQYVYNGCVVGPYQNPTDPLVVPIANSNGGWAVPTTVTLTVTNNTGRVQRHVYAQYEMGSMANSYPRYRMCRLPLTDWFNEAGAIWQTGL